MIQPVISHTQMIEGAKISVDAPYKRGMILGVGVNDADYKVSKTCRSGGKSKNLWICPIYSMWAEMLRRCYSKKFHKRQNTYEACWVCPKWLRFMEFREWVLGNEWEGLHLDKDILVPSNKCYSPENCVFVTDALNKFAICKRRGRYMLGVTFSMGRYLGKCTNIVTQMPDNLGSFDTELEAHLAWKARKHLYSCVWATKVNNKRLQEALVLRYSEETDWTHA